MTRQNIQLWSLKVAAQCCLSILNNKKVIDMYVLEYRSDFEHVSKQLVDTSKFLKKLYMLLYRAR